MATQDFFDETTEQSQVKKAIVAKYFCAWSNVMIPTVKKHGDSKLGYVDLFSGPGKYNDGTKSTPLAIIEEAIKDSNLRDMLVMIFNDKDLNNIESLKKAIAGIPGIESLKYKPQILNKEVDGSILQDLKIVQSVPTLYFVDPWGYKGVSRELISSLIKGWGCDCIVFFNYLRVNMGLNNPSFQDHMEALFGKIRLQELKTQLNGLDVSAREGLILEEFSQALNEKGGEHVLPFCFKNSQGTRTNHHLIFISKGFTGYDIMKTIMSGESSQADQGVPSFEYCPADEKQPLLFELTRPLKDLEVMLLNDFAGKRLSMRDIYIRHSVGKRYISKNYKDVLEKMELDGKISADPPYAKRRMIKGKKSFADTVMVLFPGKEK